MAIFRRIANLFRRSHVDREIDAELQAHISLRTDENVARGMSPDAARRDALVRFGNVTSTREHVAGADAVLVFDGILGDLRFAVRQLVRNPGFAATAILVLALGIASFTSIFAFVDATLIKPLPYQNPSRLVALFESMSLGPQFHLSYLDYLDWKRMNQVFTSLEIYDGSNLTLDTPTGPQPAVGANVSDGFFRTLGVTPALGRFFHDGEDLPSAPRTVILSYATWQKRYGKRSDVIGNPISINGIAYTIIGVLPREFHFVPAEPAEFWIPLSEDQGCRTSRGCHNYAAIARLKEGVTIASAASNLTAIADQLARQFPGDDAERGATVIPLTELIVGDLRPILTVLLCGAVLLMLIACVNVASLLLVRSESRKREIAVRGAIGASPGRLIRQLITEGLVLVICSLAFGFGSAELAIKLLLRLLPPSMLATMPYLMDLGLDMRVIGLGCLLSLLAGFVFCLVPALRLSRSGVGSGMREALATGGRGFSGALWRRFGSHLVTLELAIAVVLLVCAGLLGKSFYLLLHTPLGMHPDALVALRIGPDDKRYPKDPAVHALRDQIEAGVAALPGVESVGSAGQLPIGAGGGSVTFYVVGRPQHGERVEVLNREVDPGYFPTIGARFVRGRGFTRDDNATHPLVMIINQAMAKEYFPGEDPIGHKIFFSPGEPQRKIVGIVADIREGQLDAPIRAAMYLPLAQNLDRRFFLVVRSSLPDEQMLPALDSTIHGIDPTLTLSQPTVMSQRIHDSPAASLHRASAWLVGSFAGMALLLGVVGLYGVVSYSVSQRTREIGVRIALGAQRGTVYRLILSEAGWLTMVGLVAGLACSLGAAMLMRKLLFGVQAWDAAILASVAMALGGCALLATYMPAHRAATVDPIEALRNE